MGTAPVTWKSLLFHDSEGDERGAPTPERVSSELVNGGVLEEERGRADAKEKRKCRAGRRLQSSDVNDWTYPDMRGSSRRGMMRRSVTKETPLKDKSKEKVEGKVAGD
ncbi:hypothetical protein TcCL_Unassigned02443 [Trypanosoma cruzi]|nr:hypothetical protein TcCL_Unassigned02443 [Trypanosoma cruzi]